MHFPMVELQLHYFYQSFKENLIYVCMCERELERTQREQQEKIQELEMKKMKEEELKKKSKKPGKKDPKEATRKKNLPDGKQSVCAIRSLHASSHLHTVTKAVLYQKKIVSYPSSQQMRQGNPPAATPKNH